MTVQVDATYHRNTTCTKMSAVLGFYDERSKDPFERAIKNVCWLVFWNK